MSDLKLRTILENMSVIPGDHAQAAKFNDTPKLSAAEKKALREKVAKFNEYANSFAMAEGIVKTANDLAEIAKLGKTYAMNETDDMMHRDNIKRDFTHLDKTVAEFTKRARECYGQLQNLRSLYEDAGHLLGKFYEIKDINPTHGTTADMTPEEAPMEEIIPTAVAPMKLGELDANLGDDEEQIKF
jgi:hypothetical protein